MQFYFSLNFILRQNNSIVVFLIYLMSCICTEMEESEPNPKHRKLSLQSESEMGSNCETEKNYSMWKSSPFYLGTPTLVFLQFSDQSGSVDRFVIFPVDLTDDVVEYYKKMISHGDFICENAENFLFNKEIYKERLKKDLFEQEKLFWYKILYYNIKEHLEWTNSIFSKLYYSDSKSDARRLDFRPKNVNFCVKKLQILRELIEFAIFKGLIEDLQLFAKLINSPSFGKFREYLVFTGKLTFKNNEEFAVFMREIVGLYVISGCTEFFMTMSHEADNGFFFIDIVSSYIKRVFFTHEQNVAMPLSNKSIEITLLFRKKKQPKVAKN